MHNSKSMANKCFFKMAIPDVFFFILIFYSKYSKQYISGRQKLQMNVFAIGALLCKKQQLSQKCHNHCPMPDPMCKQRLYLGGSPGLVVMGRDSRFEGRGFESQDRILDGHFFHIYLL